MPVLKKIGVATGRRVPWYVAEIHLPYMYHLSCMLAGHIPASLVGALAAHQVLRRHNQRAVRGHPGPAPGAAVRVGGRPARSFHVRMVDCVSGDVFVCGGGKAGDGVEEVRSHKMDADVVLISTWRWGQTPPPIAGHYACA